MKLVLERILYYCAKGILWRHNPDVIGITGTVGKTSTKDAIYTVLSQRYNVRRNSYNYNNEIGLPLTIIGSDTGGRNLFRWLWILGKSLAYIVLPLRYPEILVLEMGADHPGDIKYLTQLAPAHVGIVTAITNEPSHMEFFRDAEQVAREKFVMYKHLNKEDWAIINLDEPRSRVIMDSLKCNRISVALDRDADLRAVEVQYSHNPREIVESPHVAGLRFKLEYKGSIVPCFIPHVVGLPQVYSTLIAAAVGTIYHLNLVEVTEAMKVYQPPKGRLNLIPGQHNALIIDDSYNSSPPAVREALAVFEAIDAPAKRIICLGNMEELGEQSKRDHTAIGKRIAEMHIDHLVTIGNKARWIGEAASKYGLPIEAVQHFENVDAAVIPMQQLVDDQSVVLVKGSQAARLEKIVKAIMAEPDRAAELLVRQYGKWTKI